MAAIRPDIDGRVAGSVGMGMGASNLVVDASFGVVVVGRSLGESHVFCMGICMLLSCWRGCTWEWGCSNAYPAAIVAARCGNFI